MPISLKLGQISLPNHQVLLEEIYGKQNAQRGWVYVHGYLSRTTGYLWKRCTETPRNEELVSRDFVRSLSWLFALASSVDVNLLEAFLRRYPGMCPYCLEEACVCIQTKKLPRVYVQPKKVLRKVRERYEYRCQSETAFNLKLACDTIYFLYPQNGAIWYHAGPSFHFAKLHEEIAEVHEAISKCLNGEKSRDAVSDELADVAAWLLGAWAIVFPTRSLDDEFSAYYDDGCPVCSRPACECKPFGGRPERLVSVAWLEKLRSGVVKLADAVPSAQKQEFLDLAQAYEQVQQTHNEPLVLSSVDETRRALSKFEPSSELETQLVADLLSVVARRE